MSKKTKQMIMTVLGVFLLGSLGLLVWHWLQPDPLSLAPASRPVTSKNRQQPASLFQNAEPQSNSTTSQMPAVVPTVPVSGNLLALTTERAKVDTLKVQVTAADLNAKLDKTGAGISRPVVVAPLPVPPLPELPAPATPLASAPRTVQGPPRVVSIFGINGSISATIRHKGKLTTLRNGERFNGGTVAITRNGVQIRTGKITTLLDFE